jgi:hypothetical protein
VRAVGERRENSLKYELRSLDLPESDIRDVQVANRAAKHIRRYAYILVSIA